MLASSAASLWWATALELWSSTTFRHCIWTLKIFSPFWMRNHKYVRVPSMNKPIDEILSYLRHGPSPHLDADLIVHLCFYAASWFVFNSNQRRRQEGNRSEPAPDWKYIRFIPIPKNSIAPAEGLNVSESLKRYKFWEIWLTFLLEVQVVLFISSYYKVYRPFRPFHSL